MSSLLESLANTLLKEDVINEVANKTGLDAGKVTGVVSTAAPLLVSAMARNTMAEHGASALLGALTKDHDGSILDNIGSFFLNSEGQSGAGIISHLLGDNQDKIAELAGKATGVESNKVKEILSLIAPVAMAVLGKIQRKDGLDASGLANLLKNEKDAAHQKSPDVMGLMGKILEGGGTDGIGDEVMQLGTSILGNLFGSK